MAVWREVTRQGYVEPGIGHEAGDLVLREAEPAMRMVGAQAFFQMWREVDDEKAPPRPQGAGCLAQRPRGVVEIVQHLMQDDEIEAVALDREREHVALAQLHIAKAGDGERVGG